MASRSIRRPLARSSFEQLGAPDVVDEHIDVSMVRPDLLGQGLHLIGIEMVDGSRNPGAAEVRDLPTLRGSTNGRPGATGQSPLGCGSYASCSHTVGRAR